MLLHMNSTSRFQLKLLTENIFEKFCLSLDTSERLKYKTYINLRFL